MVKKTKLLLPLLLSLISIFCVGYAGWTLSGTGVSTSVNASVGDVIDTSNYIYFDSTYGSNNSGIDPFSYVQDSAVNGFVDENGMVNSSAVLKFYLIFDFGNYYFYDTSFKDNGAFNFYLSLSSNSYLSSTYLDSAILNLNNSQYASGNYVGSAPRFSFNGITNTTNFSIFNCNLQVSNIPSNFSQSYTLRYRLTFSLVFNFKSSMVEEVISNISNFSLALGVYF